MRNLLALREAARDERRAQLAQAREAADKLRIEAERMAQELVELRAFAAVQSGKAAVDVDRLLEAHRYELVLRQSEQTLAGQRQLVEAEVEKRRLALVAA